MARWHCFLLLSFSTLATTTFDVIREDAGDYFIWYGNAKITCEEFSNHTAYYNGSSRSGSRCECNKPKTFSTESSTCKNFTDQGILTIIYFYIVPYNSIGMLGHSIGMLGHTSSRILQVIRYTSLQIGYLCYYPRPRRSQGRSRCE